MGLFKKNKKPRVTLALELGERTIALCETTFLKGQPATRLIQKTVLPGKDSDISQAISDLFAAHQIRQKRVYLNLPRHLVMAHFLRLPSSDEHEIKEMVKMEALKQMPYLSEEVETSFTVTRRSPDGYADVFMAVVQREVIQRLLGILKKADLTVEKIALGSESLFQWYLGLRASAAQRGPGATVLINLTSEYADIDVLEDNALLFTRAFSFKGGDASFDEKKAAHEIRLSLARERGGKTIERILMTGAEQRIPEMTAILKEETGIDAEILPQVEGLDLSGEKHPELKKESFVELLSLSWAPWKMKINLLPKHLIEAGEKSDLQKTGFRTLLLGGCILLLLFSTVVKRTYEKFAYLASLDSKIEAQKPKVKEAKKVLEEFELLKQVSVKEPLATDIVAEVYKNTPPTITLTMLDYEKGKGLTFRGSAPSLEETVVFMRTLENSAYFKNADIKYTSKARNAGNEATDFEVTCAIEKGS